VAVATAERPDVYRQSLPAEVSIYEPGPLLYDETYYWRVDEVNEAEPNELYRGRVWQFTTADVLAQRYPADGISRVRWPATLRWVPGGPDMQYDVYFGEDENAVAEATLDSVGIYQGQRTADEAIFDTGNLQPNKTYFWRIDGVDNADPENLWKGSVWQFTTANAITGPYPRDGASHVPLAVALSWTPSGPGPDLWYDVYLGEDENAVAEATPDSVDIYYGRQASDETTFDPGGLEGNATYFWRIDAVDSTDPQNMWQGDVWRFSTVRVR
jgi:hypothetical protein